jgi:hypothetical protein
MGANGMGTKSLSQKLCPECGGPANGRPHTPRICVAILKWKLEESERERRVAESAADWLKKIAGETV